MVLVTVLPVFDLVITGNTLNGFQVYQRNPELMAAKSKILIIPHIYGINLLS